MSLEDLMEQMICESIEMLIKKRPQPFRDKDMELLQSQEEVMLDEENEKGVVIETLIDDLITQTAEENRYLYLSGIDDGMKIARAVDCVKIFSQIQFLPFSSRQSTGYDIRLRVIF